MTTPIVFLVDNGSLRPQATLRLRCLAEGLARRAGLRVEAVSLLHSHKIAADKVNGIPATIVKRRLRECLAAGHREFICLPLFLGPSLAIADYLPQVVDELSGEYPGLKVRIASVLAGEDLDTRSSPCADARRSSSRFAAFTKHEGGTCRSRNPNHRSQPCAKRGGAATGK